MSTRTSVEAALRSLDVAGRALSTEQQRHAEVVLERILATPGAADARVTRGRIRRRVLSVLAAGAAAVTGAIVAVNSGGSAYASWTPEPAALTAAEIDLVAPVCRRALGRGGGLDVDRAQLMLSERRGDVVALLYRTDDPDMAGVCLLHNVAGSDEIENLDWGSFGGSGRAARAPARGFIPGGAVTSPKVTITDGAVGAQVVGVVIHAPGNLTARATVKNGRYVAWWPGPQYDVAHEGTADARSIVTYDLTLADGTVIHDATSAR